MGWISDIVDEVLSAFNDLIDSVLEVLDGFWTWIEEHKALLIIIITAVVFVVAIGVMFPVWTAAASVWTIGLSALAVGVGVSYLLFPEETAELVEDFIDGVAEIAGDVIDFVGDAVGDVLGWGFGVIWDAIKVPVLVVGGGYLGYKLLTSNSKE